ncbi:MAG: bifunctional folylpolyglutamate synthase/dihydrofolate synthase [Chitinophagales bacterium]|nr:bifunctional folylpolyglutamate synthase/dihydrofolate synthase [Chitinophagales bacterium]
MTYNECISFLYEQLPMFSKQGKSAFKKDLSNIVALCNFLNEPQEQFKSIHIAGTNGKGSVAHGLASIFQANGQKVGLYTSPHLKDFRERIKINGNYCSEDFVIDFVAKIKPLLSEIQPSYFEITVAMAFDCFAQEQVDIAIIETGLGGRLDSTNIILPQLSVITNITLEHQDMLGDTIDAIAREKAGIIKPNIPVVIGRKDEISSFEFIKKAKKEHAPIYFSDDVCTINSFQLNDEYLNINFNINDANVAYQSDLRAIYQIENLKTIIALINIYNKYYKNIINETAVENGIANIISSTQFYGRWQTLQQNPTIIIDVAHNEDGIAKAVQQLNYENYNKLHIIYGVVKDKDISKILLRLPKNANYYITEPNTERKLSATLLYEKMKTDFNTINYYENCQAALQDALKNASKNDLILIIGSFFLVSEFL